MLAVPGGLSACANHPNSSLRLAGVLMSLPQLIFGIGFLVLLFRILRVAGQSGGVSKPETSSRLRFTGWYLVIGTVFVAVIETAAAAYVLHTQTSFVPWINDTHLPSLSTLVLGLGLITIGRIVSLGQSGPAASTRQTVLKGTTTE